MLITFTNMLQGLSLSMNMVADKFKSEDVT